MLKFLSVFAFFSSLSHTLALIPQHPLKKIKSKIPLQTCLLKKTDALKNMYLIQDDSTFEIIHTESLDSFCL